jgi:hypothetical protein
VVCAVIAAGNANDHRRATREQPLIDAIVAGDMRRIDLLRLTIGHGCDQRSQYAHSYIGMGLTPIRRGLGLVLPRMATSWRRTSKVGLLLKDSEPYRVRGDVRVFPVLDETDDALVSDGPLSIRMETLSRCARRLLRQTSHRSARHGSRSWLDCHFLTNP